MSLPAALMLLAGVTGNSTACDHLKTQSAMNGCAAQVFAKADAALNAQWALTVKAMKDFDGDVPPEGDHLPGYYATLLDGQRAWLKYRDSQCLSESFDARGGTMESMLQNLCQARLTRERIEQLKALAAGDDKY